MFFDQPLPLNEILLENCLKNMDIDKIFQSKLELKNWLLDHRYIKMHLKEDYECYENKLNFIENKKDNSIPIYAIWNKNNI
jgi:hypothetical protein